MKLSLLLQLAGLLHLGLIAAGIAMPRVVGLSAHLATMPEFIRSLVWIYYAFIGYCLAAFGAASIFLADSLASGHALARMACVFLCGFWTIRLAAALFVLNVRPYLTRPSLRLGYHATNVVFALLPFIYGYAAWKGGAP